MRQGDDDANPPNIMAAQQQDAHPRWATGLHWLLNRGIDDILKADDPRVGSGRNDTEGKGTLSTSASNKTSSASKLGATFLPVAIYLAVCVVAFFLLRPRSRRVYAPRTIQRLQPDGPATPLLPLGWFNWVVPFFKISDTFILNHASLDAFLFLRYLKVLRNISAVGCLIVWPILLPINATGGNGRTQLDALTIGNVKNEQKLFAHAVVAWIFFGRATSSNVIPMRHIG
jgi:hypothetical protein